MTAKYLVYDELKNIVVSKHNTAANARESQLKNPYTRTIYKLIYVRE